MRINSINQFSKWSHQFVCRVNVYNLMHSLKICFGSSSVALVCKRTIPTERPPLVGEVSANFCGYSVWRGQRNGSPRPYSRFSRPEPLLFLPNTRQLYSRGWVDPVPDPLLLRKSGSAGNRTRDLWTTEAVNMVWRIYKYFTQTLHTYSYNVPHSSAQLSLQVGEVRQRSRGDMTSQLHLCTINTHV
jgi:hypothetical protein